MSNYTSIFDLFSIGLGPSSSHSVGPMKAIGMFVESLSRDHANEPVNSLRIELFGSLALTGKGHGTDRAIVLGLIGEKPETIDPNEVQELLERVSSERTVVINGNAISFDPDEHIEFKRNESLEFHPNGMICRAFKKDGTAILAKTYFSIGGGFVIDPDTLEEVGNEQTTVPFPFDNAAQLIELAKENERSISRIVWENELCFHDDTFIRNRILRLWEVMKQCVERGCHQNGILPGGLKVERRAPQLLESLQCRYEAKKEDPLNVLDWVDLFALAVSEENAAAGRVVTAPTNGAAGILPAVLHYYDRFCPGATEDGIVKFFLTAGAIGQLYKKNASISGAEVGCQGEVGVACSMAAGALTEVMGGSAEQVEEAAEIGMEHNLGLTCDPIGGLVQVPCIERNAMGAVKAINASRLALRGDGKHRVSLDKVIATMRRTGEDMSSNYKETSRGGLAVFSPGVNVTEC